MAEIYNRCNIYKTTVSGCFYKFCKSSDTYKERQRVPNGGTLRGVVNVGDILWVDPNNGDKYFLDKAQYSVSDAMADGLESVGIVGDVGSNGRKLLIVHKEGSGSIKFADCWLFKVSNIKLDGTPNVLNMVQYNASGTALDVGTFTDNISTTLSEFCTAFDAWLRAHPTVSGALTYDWHCELMPDVTGVNSCFIVVDNNNSYRQAGSPVKSSSTASASIYMWQFASQNTDRTKLLRNNGSLVYYAGWNAERLKQYFTSASSLSPADDPHGAGILNVSDFNSANYSSVKEYYGDYDTYINAILMQWPSDSGDQAAMAGTGKAISNALSGITYKNLSGTVSSVFTGVKWAYDRATPASRKSDDLGDGAWYVPDIVDLFKILSKLKLDYTDPINDSLAALNSSRIALNVSRGSSSRYAASSMWYTGTTGYYGGGQAFAYGQRYMAVAFLEYV